jgi:hypothetical protein
MITGASPPLTVTLPPEKVAVRPEMVTDTSGEFENPFGELLNGSAGPTLRLM